MVGRKIEYDIQMGQGLQTGQIEVIRIGHVECRWCGLRDVILSSHLCVANESLLCSGVTLFCIPKIRYVFMGGGMMKPDIVGLGVVKCTKSSDA